MAAAALAKSVALLERAGINTEAKTVADIAERVRARARGRRGRRLDHPRLWLFQNLLFIWEQCGGETHASTFGLPGDTKGGPLVRYLTAITRTLPPASGAKLSPEAIRKIVRKLLQERAGVCS